MPPTEIPPANKTPADQPSLNKAPANQKSMLIILAAAIMIIAIALGVRIEQNIRASLVEPVLMVSPASSKLSAGTHSSATPSIAALVPAVPAQYTGATVQTALPTAPVARPADQITARAYIVGNVETGHVYLSLNPNTVLPVASMSKLITTIAATDTISPTTTITITPAETDVPPDGSNLQAGESFTLAELLYPLLLDSSNVAAEAIASSSDRVKFLELMSSYAWEVGMPTAYFADPSGIDPHNHASANDMLALARYLYIYRPDILAITRTDHTSLATTTEHGSHDIVSIHPFVDDTRFLGGKTGRTPEAGETMMTILRIGGEPIAFIILGSNYGERQADTDLLIDKFEALNP